MAIFDFLPRGRNTEEQSRNESRRLLAFYPEAATLASRKPVP